MSRAERQSIPALDVEGVSLAYGNTTILENVTLAVGQAGFTALVGPNGSGKSTLLRVLAGLLRPRSGQVLVEGRPLATLSAKARARKLSLLAQAPSAPEGLTVRELVEQGRHPHRALFGGWSPRDEAACAAAMSAAGIADLARRRLDELSGGQRQRAWIGMVLAQETDILLLDEPTTFLDLAHQVEILDLVSGLVRERGKSVVAVLHDLNQALRHADHMIILKDGRVVAAGRPCEIVDAERIEQVFGTRVGIIEDPFSGRPLCIPRA